MKAQADTTDIPTSMLEAFIGLLSRFGIEPNVDDLQQILTEGDKDTWPPLHDYGLRLHEIGYLGTWPPVNKAVVKFEYQDQDQPYIDVEGQPVANMISHYCLVYDYQEHTIVDVGGVVKNPGFYGLPVGWASYRPATEEELSAEVAAERAEFNLVEVEAETTPQNDTTGKPLIIYEVYDSPKLMHVNNPNGAKKYSFGNVDSQEDIQVTGHIYPENHNVKIAARAHVPVGEDTLAYYMDPIALGDYRNTGEVKWTIGFSGQDLSDGHVERVVPPPKPVAQEKLAEQVAQEFAEEPKKSVDIAPPELPNIYKASYLPFPEGPATYLFNGDTTVQELDGRRPDKHLEENDGVLLTGTFMYKGQLMGKPKSVYWFGVPMDSVFPEEELYNTDMTLAEKVAMKQPLSVSERSLDYLGRVINKYGQVKSSVRKNKKRSN